MLKVHFCVPVGPFTFMGLFTSMGPFTCMGPFRFRVVFYTCILHLSLPYETTRPGKPPLVCVGSNPEHCCADTHLFQRGSGAKIWQKSILKQPVERDLILDAVDTFKEENDGGFVLRRQASGHRCRGYHLRLTVLAYHLTDINNS